MLETLNAIAPIVLIIALGFALYRTGAMGEDVWSAVETLCFYVLFPALFVRTLALAEFADVALWPLAASLVTMICASSLLLLALRPLLTRSFGFSDAAFTSVFQGSTRWHAFIGLAVVGALFGDAGIAIVAFMIAVTVPLLNAVNVAVLVTWGDSGAATASGMLRQMATNPFIVGCLLGGLLNATGIGLPGPLESATDFLAGGALGLGLLTVGAGRRRQQRPGARRGAPPAGGAGRHVRAAHGFRDRRHGAHRRGDLHGHPSRLLFLCAVAPHGRRRPADGGDLDGANPGRSAHAAHGDLRAAAGVGRGLRGGNHMSKYWFRRSAAPSLHRHART